MKETFRNLKTRTKALIAFGSIILISCIVCCWLLTQINTVASMTQQLYQRPYNANDLMWTARYEMLNIQSSMYKVLAADSTSMEDVSDTETSVISEASEKMNAALDGLAQMFVSPDKIAQLNEIRSLANEAADARLQARQFIQAGKHDDAYAVIASTYEPVFDQCVSKMDTLAVSVTKDATDFVQNAKVSGNNSQIVGMIMIAFGILFGVVVTGVFTNAMLRPLSQLKEASIEMSKGHLNAVSLVEYRSKDEFGALADSLRITMTNLSAYVTEISDILVQLSKGDLTVPSDKITDYLGDFSEIKQSFVTILKSFNNTLGDITVSAEQVDTSSNQVSMAAQQLSQGAAEQASAIEELTMTVNEISEQIRDNADNANNANHLTGRVNEEVQESGRHMHEMNGAMDQIQQSSQSIEKIIKTIEDIAFQTNILALNAAVEAARAGSAGKGFAVVAEEVGNLANKSAEASKSTSNLIANSLKAVENGTKIAKATAESLERVEKTTREVVDTVNRIAVASEKQADSVENVTQRVEQISSVVQTNSATAEQSAAASDELSGQATALKQRVTLFKLFKEQAY